MHNNGFMKDPETHSKLSAKGGSKKVKKGFAMWPPEKLEAMIKKRDRVRRENKQV